MIKAWKNRFGVRFVMVGPVRLGWQADHFKIAGSPCRMLTVWLDICGHMTLTWSVVLRRRACPIGGE